jgi:putative DNA primase/helicase
LELWTLYLEIDLKPSGSIAETWSRLQAFPLAPSAIVHSGGGLHVYWFLLKPLDLSNAVDVTRANHWLRDLARRLGGDLASAEPARVLRLPDTLNLKPKYGPRAPIVTLRSYCPSRRYALGDVIDVLGDAAPEAHPRKAAEPLPEEIPAGERNIVLFREGCRVRRLGWKESEIAERLRTLNESRCVPRLDAPEVRAIAARCARYAPADDAFPLTEAGDAEFFAARYADRVRYDHRRGRWLLFAGHRWAPQTDGEIHRLALDAIRARQAAALQEQDGERRTKRQTWAICGENRKRQTNLLALAQNVRPLADDGEDWDRDPWLLGVRNGVVNLRTGALRDGRPSDRVTMQCPVEYDPDATCPLWDQTLREIFAERDDLVAFVQRATGYSLTGDCREESFFMTSGGGRNGKGTVMNTIAFVWGDYADNLSFSALKLHDRGSTMSNDIAKLVGKRFVTASEADDIGRLNEARVKALTGRDPITARFLYQEEFTFQPNAKFWLATNAKPDVRDESEGFWSRIHLIPFTQSFANREDRTRKDRLRAEAAGILAWAVRGCLAWQHEGLRPPEAVPSATRAYRDETDRLAEFVHDDLMTGADLTVTAGDFFQAYQRWCARQGIDQRHRLGRHTVLRLARARFTVEKSGRTVIFRGVTLREPLPEKGDAEGDF